MHTKILVALLGTSLGIILGLYTKYGTEISIITLCVGVLQLVLYRYVSTINRKSHEHTHTKIHSVLLPVLSAIFFFAVTFGIIRVQFIEEKVTIVCKQACSQEVVVVSSPRIQDIYQIFTVAIKEHQEENSHSNEHISYYDIQVRAPLYPRHEVGDTLTLFGKVAIPEPTMQHTNARTFDYLTYLHLHDIGSEMFYPSIQKIESRIVQSKTLTSRLEHLRVAMVSHIAQYVSAPSASLASGMLFGSTSMSKELLQTFRVAGLSHIIVLSGFNIVILISATLLILVFVPLILRIVLAAVLVIFFVIMVGAEASVVRATVMSFIALLALLVGRGYTARNALSLSLLCIIIYQPLHLLADVSLHLSFLATAGIVYMSDTIHSFLTRIRSDTYKEIITTTIAAYLGTLPYVLYTFGTASLYALLTNLIVLPLVPVMMLITFLVVVVSPFSTVLASILGYIDTVLGTFIIFIARMAEALPFSLVTVTISFLGMCVMYMIMCVVYLYMKKIIQKKKTNETQARKSEFLESEIIKY